MAVISLSRRAYQEFDGLDYRVDVLEFLYVDLKWEDIKLKELAYLFSRGDACNASNIFHFIL